MKKRLLSIVSLMIILAVILSACGGTAASSSPAPTGSEGGAKTLKKVGIVHFSQSWEIYIKMEKAIREMAAKDGVEIITADGAGDTNKQISGIDAMLAANVDGVICVTGDSDALEPSVKKLQQNGIAYISLFMSVESSTVDILVNEYDYGYAIGTLAGKWAQANFPGENLQAALLRMHDYKPGIERGKGMQDAFTKEFPTGEVVNDQHSVDVESAMKATEAILQANPDTKIFMCDSDDTGAIGANEVLKAKVKAEEQSKYCVIGADGTGQALDIIKEGGMYRGTIDIMPDQIGIQAYGLIKEYVEGKTPEKTQYIAFKPVDTALAQAEY